MCLKRVTPRHKQTGLGLVSAIFVITVLAVLITSMARLLTLGQQVTVQEFLGARAVTAAQTGIELELACLENIGGSDSRCDADNAVEPVGTAASSFDYWPSTSSTATFNVAGLEGCRAEVYYRTVSAAAGNFWTISSTGICGGSGLDGASRRIVIRAAQNP